MPQVKICKNVKAEKIGQICLKKLATDDTFSTFRIRKTKVQCITHFLLEGSTSNFELQETIRSRAKGLSKL